MGPFEEAAQTPAVANPAPAEAAREGRQGRGEPAVFPVTRASGMRTLPTSSAPPPHTGAVPCLSSSQGAPLRVFPFYEADDRFLRVQDWKVTAENVKVTFALPEGPRAWGLQPGPRRLQVQGGGCAVSSCGALGKSLPSLDIAQGRQKRKQSPAWALLRPPT